MANPYELLAGLALLREKKRRLQQRNDTELQEWSGFQIQLGNVACLIPCTEVEEVITPENIASVRGVANWIRGVVYCRAHLVTLIDVPRLLLNEPANLSSGRIFVMRGQQEWFGLQVSTFDGVRHIWSYTPVCEAPANHQGVWLQYVQQWLLLDNRPVAVLNAKILVTKLEKQEKIGVEVGV